jgi:hypothetical protein
MTHLSHSIDLMRLAKSYSDKSQNKSNADLAKRLILSSIIHAFAGLESFVNLLGYELFSNSDSPIFIPVEQRDFFLNKMAKSWDTVSCLDKISFILSHSAKCALPAKLENQLRELNNLRNWLVHGFTYKQTFLLEPSSDVGYKIVDTQDSVDWAKKFPNTKFKAWGELGTEDAHLALTIVFGALKVLSDSTSQPLSLFTCLPEPEYKFLVGDYFDIQAIIEIKDV